MPQNERSLHSRIDVKFVINVAGMVLPIFITVITIPVYIRSIGEARFGVLSIIWLLLGYAGFLDLGLTRASENALAKSAERNSSTRARILVTAGFINFGLGLIGSFVFILISRIIFDRFLLIPEALRAEIDMVIPWVAALFPLALIAGVVSGALDSRENFLLANLLSFGSTVLIQLIPVSVAIVFSPSLASIVPAAVLSRGFSIFIIVLIVYSQERPLKISDFDIITARELFGYGGWVAISSIISPILVSLDQFVIGSRLGVSSVTYYAVPMNLVSKSQLFALALSRTLFPRFSRLSAESARILAQRATCDLALGSAVVCVPAIIAVQAALDLWMGSKFAAQASPVAEILIAGAWINGVAFIPYGLLQAQGRPDITAKYHIIEVVPYIGVLWFATFYYGLIGAAAAWTLRVSIDAVLMIAAAGFGLRDIRKVVFTACIVASSYLFATIVRPSPGAAWTTAVCVSFLIATLAFSLNKAMRSLATDIFKRLYFIGRVR